MNDNHKQRQTTINQSNIQRKCFDWLFYCRHSQNIQNQKLFSPETNNTVYPVTVGFSFNTLQ